MEAVNVPAGVGLLSRGGSSFIKRVAQNDRSDTHSSGKAILRAANTMRNGDENLNRLIIGDGSGSLIKK